MSSKHSYCSSGDSSSFDSYSDSSSSSSDYHSKHKRKKHKSKHHKRKHKEKKRHKKHKKEKKSKHHKKSGSKSKTKHKHSKKRHRNQNKSNSHSNEQPPKHKKRKLSNNKTDHYTQQKMITNAKSVLNMFCDNDQTKQFMTNIFAKLDNNESISISNQNLEYQKPLKMIFTFLSLHSNDQIHYTRNDKSISLLSMFKSELKTHVSTIKTLKNTNFIGPIMPPSNPITQTSDIKSSDNCHNSEFIGVAMPTNEDLLNNKYSSEGEEDDDYGPDVVNGNDDKRYLQMTHTKIYNEMSKKIKGEQVLDNSNNKREEWITTMPDSFLSDFDKAKNRAFNTNSNEQKMDKTWMETPADLIKQRKEKKRIMRIHKDTNKKLKKIGLPTVKQHNKNTLEVEENVNNNRDMMEKEKDNDSGQRKSLFEVHQEKLMLEYKEELKEWKRKKKKGKKVGAKPVFKGAIRYDSNASYGGRMENYYNAQNPTFTRSKLNTFVSAGTMDDY